MPEPDSYLRPRDVTSRPPSEYSMHSTTIRARGHLSQDISAGNPPSRCGTIERDRSGGGGSSSAKYSPDSIRRKLENVLANKNMFRQSAMASFNQFDRDKSGTLDFQETKALIERLVQNLSLPPIDDETLTNMFYKYAKDDFSGLTIENFYDMYWQILLRVRDKYYPSRSLCVRRSFFVGRTALAAGQIRKLFNFEKKLGAGAFGEVHLVTERSSGLRRCCKTINKDKAAVPVEQIEAEVEVLKTLDHPNIIKIFEVYEDYNNIYIIQEVCEGGELLDRVSEANDRGKVLTERYVREVIRQVMEALAYFHAKRICHKDLKPENVLFQDADLHSAVKVIDFGLAEIFKKSDEYSPNAAGTVLYMAPEVFARRVTMRCDVWSAGCIMFQLLTGHLPFNGRSVSEVKNKAQSKEPPYDHYCRHVSAEAIDLMQKMLAKSPKQRISAAQALQHPWFMAQMSRDVPLDSSVCLNLKAYTRHSGLKAALINMMTHQLNFNGSQIKKLSKIFKQLDTDNSGTLSPGELSSGLEKAGIEAWHINKILQALDVDGSGDISYTEFLAAAYSWRESELNIMWTAFSKMDKDRNGRISVDEFVQLLQGDDTSRLLKEEDIAAMMTAIDKNGDGVIEWDEFVGYMRSIE
eukprot:Blabericola_migrator_1__3228@NODE_194_length_11541_cov_124_962524_g167_i0_p3_GENE_NODE_194_length_11541_cov_124_962524_g167_i0NODE_194_length_11541_cov_124_962524_g167_i0_p3_ORF_typecomplete_len636_score103_37Pkinase/PF00069_25/4e71Pkinase/PF00069_25/4_1e03Pkinase_Tyr/PF07714_17/8_8e50EFhand_7/PF13499_6/0_00059EFhand_7/PF13499_6/5_5e03EFhand_7/PF13499_6/4_2e13EFhand_7/PF13499_6/8_1e15EFhand_1/PF00036_32/0_0022EFhand_1/PF00036_32/0_0024EFhand_1/PF00036_32/0_0028EFhand_1/PF00036_32/7_5e07EFhand_1/